MIQFTTVGLTRYTSEYWLTFCSHCRDEPAGDQKRTLVSYTNSFSFPSHLCSAPHQPHTNANGSLGILYSPCRILQKIPSFKYSGIVLTAFLYLHLQYFNGYLQLLNASILSTIQKVLSGLDQFPTQYYISSGLQFLSLALLIT